MSKPVVVMTAPMLPLVQAKLDAAVHLHRLWQIEDRERFFTETGPAVRAVVGGPAVRIDRALIDRFPALEIIGNFGVGYDSVDAAYAGSRGIIVTNTPDVLTEEVADTTLGLILMTLRELGAAERYLRAGQWLTAPYPLTRATLRDRRVGVLGLGRIGKAIATRLVAFGCPIHYFGRTRQSDVPYTYHDDLVAMARAVDVLVNVAPGGAATRHLINARVLEALGPEGVLINVGRGTTVDEAALIDALERGVIWSAGLDVFEDEPRVPPALIAHERVCLLPHVASASVHTRNAMGQLVVDNVLGWLNDRRVLTPVPEAMPPRSA